MNRFEKRKLKSGIYKHVNALMYTCIFAVASIITIAAAVNRTDEIVYMDEEQVVSTVRESVAFTDKAAHKVAVGESETEENASNDVTENITDVPTEPDTTVGEPDTSQAAGNTVKVIADTLNVRAQANEEAEVLGMADEGDVYTIISEQGEWIEIDYNGNNGFVKSEFVEIQE